MENDEQLKIEHKLFEAGTRLEIPTTSKDELVEALEKVEACLLLVKQAPSVSTLNAMFPSQDSLITPYLMRHPDKDVMLLVISCFTQIARITAPDEPYNEEEMKEIFQLIVGSFKELGKMNSPSFKRRFVILKTVGEIKLYTVMLDIDNVILHMFKHFLSAVSQNNYSNDVYDSMKTIMCGVLDESDDISEELLSVLFINLRKGMRDFSPAAHFLCLDVVASCAEKLGPYFTAKHSSNQENICSCLHGYEEIVYDICRDGNQEINATQYTTACPEVILQAGSGNAEPVATSLDNPNPEVSSSEVIRDEKMSKKKKKEAKRKMVSSNAPRQRRAIKQSRIRENPMPMADRADKGCNAVCLTEAKAAKSKNNPSVPKSLNPSSHRRKFPRKNSISEMERTVEAFVEDENMVGRKIQVWWPFDKEFYEGVVESYDPKSKRHGILYFDGERENLKLRKQRWGFIDNIARLEYN